MAEIHDAWVGPETYHIFTALTRLGRLGNQLWQIASVLGLADKAGQPPRFMESWPYRRYFSIPEEFFELIPVGSKTRDYPLDYMQRYTDWSHLQETIRTYFQPSQLALEEMQAFYPGVWSTAPWAIAVHVRLTDYLSLGDKFVNLGPDYYDRALCKADPGHQALVLVFSDDPDRASQMIRRPHVAVKPVMPPSCAEVCELFLMARCGFGQVIANSTFSWWAAYLGGNSNVVYPDQWGHPGFDLYYRLHEFIPKDKPWLSCRAVND